MATRAQLKRQRQIERERERACGDLFYLSQRLGYDLMSEEFHGPICQWLDDNQDHTRTALFSPRKSYKSRLAIVEWVQEILRDYDAQILLIHNNLRLANELVVECGELFVKNQWLRSILPPEHRPPTGKQGAAWIKRTDGGEFTLPGVKSSATPTLRGASSKQGWTGAHPKTGIWLDDVIHDETVEHLGGVDAVRDWIKHTIIPLVGQTGKIRVRGTFWSHDDWYHDLIKQRRRGPDGEPGTGEHRWKFQVHAILEDENGDPDWDGQPIKIYVRKGKGPRRFLTMEDVEDFMDEMGTHFAGQMMNCPRPDGSLPWTESCKRTCTFEEVKPYIQAVVLTMDPAPLGMTLDGFKLKKKKGKKDDWSMAVIGFASFPNINGPVRILLDGRFSDDWATQDAMPIATELIKKWRAELAAVEEGSASMENEQYFGRALKEELDKYVTTRNYVKIVKLKGRQQGKSHRILDLCAMAARGRFLINTDRDMDKKFLAEFLHQVGQWSGKDSIPKDDVLDSVAYCDDPAVHEEITVAPMALRDDPFSDPRRLQPRQPRRQMFRHMPAGY